jgi:hypothetical protein
VYFEHIKVHTKDYYDGGLISNNPVQEAYDEAMLECPDHHFEAIVSIGTGKPPYKSPPKTVFAALQRALSQMTDTEAKHVEFLEKAKGIAVGEGEFLSDRYFRLNDKPADDKSKTGLYKIDLAAYRDLDKVEELANKFVTSAAGSKIVKDCAARLAFRRPIRP